LIHSDQHNLDLPDDYPVAEAEGLHAHVSRDEQTTKTIEWKEWSNGLNGLMYRFLACDEHGTRAIASLRESTSPAQPERYLQEKWLFAFFFEGLSALECLYYGLYFIGALANPRRVDPTIKRRDVVPRFVANTYGSAYPQELLTQRLNTVVVSTDFREWGRIRNALGHRGAPGRTFYEGGAEHGQVDWNLPVPKLDIARVLNPDELERRREWLGAAIAEIVTAAAAFVRTHVP
jgi:hypothetical protein